jgi:hypothetical protein
MRFFLAEQHRPAFTILQEFLRLREANIWRTLATRPVQPVWWTPPGQRRCRYLPAQFLTALRSCKVTTSSRTFSTPSLLQVYGLLVIGGHASFLFIECLLRIKFKNGKCRLQGTLQKAIWTDGA